MHLRSLTSAFVIHLLRHIISTLATSDVSAFQLVSVAEVTGLSIALSETPKTGFVASSLIITTGIFQPKRELKSTPTERSSRVRISLDIDVGVKLICFTGIAKFVHRETDSEHIMSFDCLCSVALPHSAVGWSAVRECGIS